MLSGFLFTWKKKTQILKVYLIGLWIINFLLKLYEREPGIYKSLIKMYPPKRLGIYTLLSGILISASCLMLIIDLLLNKPG
jgi:hypothetical protein